MPSYRPPAARC
jgi:hypothetical protein